MINFKPTFNKQNLKLIEEKIKNSLMGASVKERIVRIIMNSISIRKWNIFLTSEQFRADFGIDAGGAKNMWSDFTSIVSDVNIVRDSSGVSILGLDQNRIRAVMDHVWTNKAGRRINVNAWDIYEYGVIGDSGKGRIFGHHVSPITNSTQKRYSRSGLAVMKRGGSVSFNKGQSPGIGAVRLDVSNMIKVIPEQVGQIIRGTIL